MTDANKDDSLEILFQDFFSSLINDLDEQEKDLYEREYRDVLKTGFFAGIKTCLSLLR